MTVAIQNLERWDRYFESHHEELRGFFKNADAFYTFLKNNRERLTQESVVVKTTYGLFVDRQRLPAAILDTITVEE